MNRLIPRQKVWLTVVATTNAALWLIPSNVVEQIARDRPTLLGRYSRTHFTWIVVVALISVVSFYIDWSTGPTYKRRWFQVLATLLAFVPCVVVVDYLARSPATTHYIHDTAAYHRPVNARFHVEFTDRPEAALTYPDAPPGYGTVSCTATTDKNGFRNRNVREQYDVVVLGDSFAEGSKVSDDQTWPARLARRSGLSVYNLGMSGYDPSLYLASLRAYGLALKPDVVICLLYEGNDFRSAKADRKRARPSLGRRLRRYVKQSPILQALDRTMIETLGGVNIRHKVAGIEILDWMPLAIPSNGDTKYYAFAPKQVRDLFESRTAFARDRHWLNPRRRLQEMREACDETGSRFIVVFAPSKAHVTLSLVLDRLPADHVRAFLALHYKSELPEAKAFVHELRERIDAREAVVRDWCRRESIPFLSLTEALRDDVDHGRQVYYTYDQHWTPDGHQRVAQAIHDFLRRAPAGAPSANGDRTSKQPRAFSTAP